MIYAGTASKHFKEDSKDTELTIRSQKPARQNQKKY